MVTMLTGVGKKDTERGVADPIDGRIDPCCVVEPTGQRLLVVCQPDV